MNAATGCQTEKRRAYRTVLDTMFHALVRWLAPVLVFTSEEVWGTRYPDGGSVHLLEWPEIPDVPRRTIGRWAKAARAARARSPRAIEPLRRDKVIGSSLEAEVTVPELPAPPERWPSCSSSRQSRSGECVSVEKTDNKKCGRCWRYLPEVEEDGALCGRCEDVVNA